jgi:hypothetical protein
MHPSQPTSNLRLIAVFLMGISVGICLTLMAVTLRDPRPVALHHPAPAPEQGSRK